MKIYQIDAFTTELFRGNPAAVVPLVEWLPENVMQQIAMENNLAETAFLVKEGLDFRIRWFTPSTEVDLCGHATLASAFVLYNYEGYTGDTIRFHSRSGLLTVSRKGDLLSLNFPAIQLSPRGGWLECELIGDRVLITGRAAAYLTGEIMPAGTDIVAVRGDAQLLPGALTIAGAQQLVDQWIRATGVRYFSELTNMAILTEEVGEVARLISRLYGDQSFKDSDKGRDLSDELADVLWVLICIANQTGVDLTAALTRNLEKKNVRDSVRHKSNPKLR